MLINQPLQQPDPRDRDNWPQEIRDDAGSDRNLLERILDRDLSSTHSTAGRTRETLIAELSEINTSDDQARNNVLADVQARLDELEAEYTPRIEAQQAEINRLEPMIKTNVLTAQRTIKGETSVDCQYVKASHTWDSKLIDGFAVAHPEINVARIDKPASARFMSKQSRSQKASDQ